MSGGQSIIAPKFFEQDNSRRIGLVANQDIEEGQEILSVYGSLCATAIDAQNRDDIKNMYKGVNELTLLSLWLCFEKLNFAESAWKNLIASLPDRTNSPLLWTEEQVNDQLKGSSVYDAVKTQRTIIDTEWQMLLDSGVAGRLDKQSFCAAWCVCLKYGVYLPSAQCSAIVPILGHMRTTANNNGCNADFDVESGSVKVTATRPYRQGQEVMLNDSSNSGELLMNKGYIDETNAFDYLNLTASLVMADKLYSMKKDILQSFQFEPNQQFPVMEDRIPLQLLSYLRLSRIQDPAQIAKISFQKDVIISQSNEYEVLQLLLGECRDRLSVYKNDYEQDVKLLQRDDLNLEEKLACQLRIREKKILGSTMDAVRRRLAPIRGIPTKSGKMADPNQDLQEIFEVIETLPQQPKKFIDNLFGWDKKSKDPKSFR